MRRFNPVGSRGWHGRFLHRRAALCLALLIGTASCVHDDPGARIALPSAPSDPDTTEALALASLAEPAPTQDSLSVQQALAANAALPLSPLGDTSARPLYAGGTTALDQLRSLDCLAQAIYYEARSESEDGQRAVAQVVLNRMRHPAYPASVCGVVYQGPMRAGGGCQFTFTCDGSLRIAPSGLNWLRARQIAGEALAGGVYAPVGHATHYHTIAVFPHWAPRLIKSALIGAHIFYRFPGKQGAPGAFSQAYAGREPMPVPGPILVRSRPDAQLAALAGPISQSSAPIISYAPLDDLPAVRETERGLPLSRIRTAYLNAGRPRSEPAAELAAR